ncbi:LysM peptidoglycan-binding domain-containing protein [Methylobacterium komagatae]
MTTGRLRRGIVLALAGLIAGFGIVLGVHWFGDLVRQDEMASQSKVPALAPEANLGTPPGGPSAPAYKNTPEAGKPTAPGPKPSGEPPASATPPETSAPKEKAAEADSPRFDIVRVEPNGDAVVAGRGKPNTVVEMLVDGKPVARALADPNGQFAIVPPALPKGSSEITLRSKTSDGQETRSSQTVAVSVSPEGNARPLVALTAPDAPTVVLSQPGAPATPPFAAAKPGDADGTEKKSADQAAPGKPDAPVRIVSVDSEPGGRLFVTGMGKPGTDVRLYLNDTLIAPARIGADGRVTFTIGSGVATGRYQVRIDEIDPKTNRVLRRAEVPFAMPQEVAEASQNASGRADHSRSDHAKSDMAKSDTSKSEAGRSAPSKAEPGRAEAGSTPPSDAMAATRPRSPADSPPLDGAGRVPGPDMAMDAGAVFVPGIATARITRGDNLWQISKRIYGRGERYTVIYDANQAQIRDPDLIYPGQIFVLPNDRRG